MYKIIGADQKEYGPVSADQLRQWVSEGRVNGQTMVYSEGATEWKPLSAFPEFADVLQKAAPPVLPVAGAGRSSSLSIEEILARDYDLDFGGCIARSWELIKQNFWLIIGVSFLIWLISFAINQLISLASRPAIMGMVQSRQVSATGLSIFLFSLMLSSPIYSVLTAGLMKFYLKLIRGEGATIADAFSGFSPVAGQLILLGLVTWILNLLGLALCILPGIYLSICWVFSMPLVIDRNLNFWDAMQLSRKVVSRHWFTMFGFVLVIGLLGACGIFACCLGLLVTMPIALGALLYAYEDLFSRQGP
ncbi:MAG TPA: GYF domain-containing protein [Patescibacteria group bacterium]|nr:GYF domain-containing protein [Patescibacteria group bacterium]